jgi:hypothetical protein
VYYPAMKNPLSVILVALLTFVIARGTRSQNVCDGDCRRIDVPACESAWAEHVSAVFLGIATDVRDLAPEPGDVTAKWEVTFRVKEAFRGVSEHRLTVLTGGDNCGFPFSKEQEYLVFANRRADGKFYVSICAGTKFAKEAGRDLQYLRGLRNEPQGSTIFGRAFQYVKPIDNDPHHWGVLRAMEPMVGQQILIEGHTKRYETLVDRTGHFKITGLEPGRYTISIDAAGSLGASQRPVVADKGCAEIDFQLEPPPARQHTDGH